MNLYINKFKKIKLFLRLMIFYLKDLFKVKLNEFVVKCGPILNVIMYILTNNFNLLAENRCDIF